MQYQFHSNMKKEASDEVQMAVMAEGIKNIETKVNSIDMRLRDDYVTNDKLLLTVEKVARLEKWIYGCIGVVMTSISLAIISLVIK